MSMRSGTWGLDPSLSLPYFTSNSLHWSLSPVTLLACLDKQNEQLPVTANLPAKIKIVILYDIEFLPFSSTNLSSGADYGFWAESENLETKDQLRSTVCQNSTLTLVANSSKDQTAYYQLSGYYQKAIMNKEYEEQQLCKALLLVYQRKVSK